jgi:hypothetical protein
MDCINWIVPGSDDCILTQIIRLPAAGGGGGYDGEIGLKSACIKRSSA